MGIAGILADPKLELHATRQGKIAENDTYWSALVELFASTGAFPFASGANGGGDQPGILR